MLLGIDTVAKNESGDELEKVGDPENILSRFVTAAEYPDATVCLRFIDAYGDACFNQLQIPFLVRELENAVAKATTPKVKQHLREVADLVKRVQMPHTYVWFVGD